MVTRDCRFLSPECLNRHGQSLLLIITHNQPQRRVHGNPSHSNRHYMPMDYPVFRPPLLWQGLRTHDSYRSWIAQQSRWVLTLQLAAGSNCNRSGPPFRSSQLRLSSPNLRKRQIGEKRPTCLATVEYGLSANQRSADGKITSPARSARWSPFSPRGFLCVASSVSGLPRQSGQLPPSR